MPVRPTVPTEPVNPADPADPDEHARARARRLLREVLRSERAATAWSVAGGLVYQLAYVSFPWLLGRGIDEGVVGRDRGAAVLYGAAVAGLVVVIFLGSAGLSWWSTKASTRAGNALRQRLLGHVLRLDAEALRDLGEGDLVTRGSRDVDQIRGWLAGFGSAVTGAAGFVVILAMIALLDPLLALVGLATVPVLAVLGRYFPRLLAEHHTALSGAHADRADAMDDLLAAGTALRGIGSGPELLRRHHRLSASVTRHSVRVARTTATWNASAAAVPGLATAVGLFAGGLAVLDGRLGIGGLVAFTSWMTMLRIWVAVLALRITQLSQARTAARRLGALFALQPALPEPAADRACALPARGVLSTDGPVELCVQDGEFVAVTGVMGSGKSTLARRLGRLAGPGPGRIRFGGVDLADAALGEVRARICVVPQQPVLVSGTLAENLSPNGTHSEAELRAACRAACIDDWILAQSEGYATAVGEGGSTLSGGQRQRLGLARALLARPAVLVLDDVTSAVDTATETSILTALRTLPDRPSVVFPTLRTEVAAAADRVIGIGAETETETGAGAGETCRQVPGKEAHADGHEAD